MAHSYGLCQHMIVASPGLASREAVLGESLKYAREICEGAPRAVGAALRAVKGGTLRDEEREYNLVVHTQDRKRGLEAFSMKVKPEFRGH